MAKLSQDQRVARLDTPFGHDVLALSGFNANESLSELFQISVETVSEEKTIDFDKAIGQSCQIEYRIAGGKTRWFNGILTEARATGQSQSFFGYGLVLRPWFCLLAHRADCRIFLDKTVLEIISDVFSKAGFSGEYEIRTQESYPSIPYCVQYRETDFAFVSRMMEENGIYYYFEHTDGHHTMVLADGLGSHRPNPVDPVLPYRQGWLGGGEQCLYDWVSERRFTTGKFKLNDYDPVNPSKHLISSKTAGAKYARGDYEVYDYPGRYDEEERGEQLAKFRLQAEQSFDRRRYCDGAAPSLFPGTVLAVTDHPTGSENGQYLLTRCSHHYAGNEYRSGGGHYGVSSICRGSYELLPTAVPFRAIPSTPRPKIYGIQTAKVVGKKGEENEEISTDEHGRIWVRFPWDRENQNSCPIRVAQAWAGQRWGEIFLPRIGMEVVVEYLEGDPDHPLVVGCVYNGNNKVPYDLPTNKTKSGIKSESSKGGRGFNEWNFEDKKGHEQINVHAQKDLNVVVLNNETRSVGANMATTVGNSETHTVGKNFKPPTGSPSRKTTIENGDDQLDVKNGAILTTAKVKMEFTVGPSKLTIDPTGITLEAPTITIKAQTTCVIQGLPVKIN